LQSASTTLWNSRINRIRPDLTTQVKYINFAIVFDSPLIASQSSNHNVHVRPPTSTITHPTLPPHTFVSNSFTIEVLHTFDGNGGTSEQWLPICKLIQNTRGLLRPLFKPHIFIQKVWIFVKLNLRKLIPVKLDKASSNMPDFEACYVILLTCLYRVCYFSGSNSDDYTLRPCRPPCGCFTSESTVETLSGLKKMSELGK